MPSGKSEFMISMFGEVCRAVVEVCRWWEKEGEKRDGRRVGEPDESEMIMVGVEC